MGKSFVASPYLCIRRSMKLQILVPQYNETDEIIKPLLDSVAIQQNVDFKEIGVIICNDGSETYLSREFLDSYPFQIDYHLEKHRGISATRNSCLDYAEADYVMFCDADDMFCSVCGLYQVFLDISKGFDTMTSSFIEETREKYSREIVYTTRDFDSTYVHGKVHRRMYLVENNIRFNDALKFNEDSYFTVLAQSLTENHIHCKTPFYLWRWRDDSVSRRDPKSKMKNYPTMVDANDALVDELWKRGLQGRALMFVVYMMVETYYTINKRAWIEHAYYIKVLEQRIASYYKKHKSQWDSVSYKDKVDIALGLRERAINEEMGFEKITFEEWLERLEEYDEYKKTETDIT